MKRFMTILLGVMLSTIVAVAKDIKTYVVTTTPQMHCENCEKKIKNGLRFVKGVKDITTDVTNQTVTIKYDADKTSTDAFVKAFEEIGYTVKEVCPGKATACASQCSQSTQCGPSSKCGQSSQCSQSTQCGQSSKCGQSSQCSQSTQCGQSSKCGQSSQCSKDSKCCKKGKDAKCCKKDKDSKCCKKGKDAKCCKK